MFLEVNIVFWIHHETDKNEAVLEEGEQIRLQRKETWNTQTCYFIQTKVFV